MIPAAGSSDQSHRARGHSSVNTAPLEQGLPHITPLPPSGPAHNGCPTNLPAMAREMHSRFGPRYGRCHSVWDDGQDIDAPCPSGERLEYGGCVHGGRYHKALHAHGRKVGEGCSLLRGVCNGIFEYSYPRCHFCVVGTAHASAVISVSVLTYMRSFLWYAHACTVVEGLECICACCYAPGAPEVVFPSRAFVLHIHIEGQPFHCFFSYTDPTLKHARFRTSSGSLLSFNSKGSMSTPLYRSTFQSYMRSSSTTRV